MADSIYPNVLKTDAQGRTTAEFDGHVKASGVELPETAIAPNNDSKVLWTRADGREGGYVATYEVSPGHDAAELVAEGDTTGTAFVHASNGGGDDASLTALAAPGFSAIFAAAGGLQVKVLDGSGDSDFAYESELAGKQDADKIHAGHVTMFWPGGTPSSNVLDINAGWPAHNPSAAFLTGSAGFAQFVGFSGGDIFNARLTTPGFNPGAGASADLWWVAIY